MDSQYIDVLVAIGIICLGTSLTFVSTKLGRSFLGKITSKTKSKTDDFILDITIRTARPLGYLASLTLAWKILPIANSEYIDKFVLGIVKFLVLILLVRLLNKTLIRLTKRWAERLNDDAVLIMVSSLMPMIRAVIWGIGLVVYLQNIGVQMAAIWALLSAGGIGAGLALKEPVQEFFDYVTILLDKPFQNGQFINIDNVWAKVERVGVRSTRLRSINGEIIVMSNSALTNGIISNYAEMDKRRILHKLGVVYETDAKKLEEIPNIIKEIIDSTEDATYDRCHFVEFGSFSLDFELVYFIPTNDYLRAMNAQENINLKIFKRFEIEGIEFAYPTQKVNLHSS